MINLILRVEHCSLLEVWSDSLCIKNIPKIWQLARATLTSNKCSRAVHGLGQQYPTEIYAPHSKCTAFQCSNASMGFGTQPVFHPLNCTLVLLVCISLVYFTILIRSIRHVVIHVIHCCTLEFVCMFL